MTIVNSEITHDSQQADGRRDIREVHVDHLGVEHVFSYLGEADTDAQAVMAERVAELEVSLMIGEIGGNVNDISRRGKFATPKLNYSQAIDNGFALKSAYEGMIGLEAILTGEYLDTLTDERLSEIFQFPPGGAATFRAEKLVPATAIATALRSETGQ